MGNRSDHRFATVASATGSRLGTMRMGMVACLFGRTGAGCGSGTTTSFPANLGGRAPDPIPHSHRWWYAVGTLTP
jgi:hypothetical protein